MDEPNLRCSQDSCANKANETPQKMAQNRGKVYVDTYNKGMALYQATLASSQTIPVLIQGQRQHHSPLSRLPGELIDEIGKHLRHYWR